MGEGVRLLGDISGSRFSICGISKMPKSSATLSIIIFGAFMLLFMRYCKKFIIFRIFFQLLRLFCLSICVISQIYLYFDHILTHEKRKESEQVFISLIFVRLFLYWRSINCYHVQFTFYHKIKIFHKTS